MSLSFSLSAVREKNPPSPGIDTFFLPVLQPWEKCGREKVFRPLFFLSPSPHRWGGGEENGGVGIGVGTDPGPGIVGGGVR